MADEKEEVESPDIHFEPVVQLLPVDVKTLEENEEELIKLLNKNCKTVTKEAEQNVRSLLHIAEEFIFSKFEHQIVELSQLDLIVRAKLFRYDSSVQPPEWKERGTGDVKLLRHKDSQQIRVVMRRDKTLKICANHYIMPNMVLMPNCDSDRAWVWNTPADFADEESKAELLAIRFANADNAQKFKEKFEEAKRLMKELDLKQKNGMTEEKKGDDETETVVQKLEELKVKEVSSGGDTLTAIENADSSKSVENEEK